jgi:arabinan endo-1,5-alpha-L-arabinosidase
VERHSLMNLDALPMSYRNPVYAHEFADPFVLKFNGSYWAYSTGFQPDGRVFGILRSSDLAHWDPSGGAMEPLPGGHTCYWAPEVTYEDDGSFLMYYSVGNEEHMVIRVARAEQPGGPFTDVGVELTSELFAIDAHVFKDEDGSRYLFFATDFLSHTHIGTGTVVARMKDPFSLGGDAVPVTRARYDWQVYDPNRASKGGVRWHTVEGPFVLKHKGTYYQMFSGGNWQNLSYGVSYATTNNIVTDGEWRQHADGERVLPILRTHPGRVVGPGHNSVVRGPNNRDLYCVYHEWVGGERVLAIDRLDWRGPELILLGPTTDIEHGPFVPITITPEDTDSEGHDLSLMYPGCLLELAVKLGPDSSLELVLESESGEVLWRTKLEPGSDLLSDVWHPVHLDLDFRNLEFRIANRSIEELTLSESARVLRVQTHGKAEISPIEQTIGWEDLFDGPSDEYLVAHGWHTNDRQALTIVDKNLVCTGYAGSVSLHKPIAGLEHEVVVNVRLDHDALNDPAFVLSVGPSEEDIRVTITGEVDKGTLKISRNNSLISALHLDTKVGRYHQIRLLTLAGETGVSVDGSNVIAIPQLIGDSITIAMTAGVAIDMVRFTQVQSSLS